MYLKKNCCDGIYQSLDVHFTSACDNECAHCVDMRFSGLGIVKPDPEAIARTVIENSEGIDDVLFLGGEPCLFLPELVDCVRHIKSETRLKVFVTTAVPKTCYDNYPLFLELLNMLDGINLSVQHHDEGIADLIRRTTSVYPRQEFYRGLPNKDKIRINLNVVRPFLHTRWDIEECVLHCKRMGYDNIKLSEIQHGKEHYVSVADLFGLSLPSPYSGGCQTYVDLTGNGCEVLLKRSCFLCEESLTATIADGVKLLAQMVCPPKNNYGVIYGNGALKGGWV